MRIEDFDFELPEEQIAQQPLTDRSASRMLVVDRAGGTFADRMFAEFPRLLRRGDTLVLNNTKVFPARIFGRTETSARIEVFLVRNLEGNNWEALARPARRLKIGRRIAFAEDFAATVVEKTEDGRVIIEFSGDADFEAALDRVGRTPLPPYIKRDSEQAGERERYQTVFASERGAIAAPTAGLHFTPEILEEIQSSGVAVTEITLHVGYGTFEPIRVSNLAEHRVMGESYQISEAAAAALNRARTGHGRTIAVGTTVTRTLEHLANVGGEYRAGRGVADLTVTPGYRFRAIDGILTNFHLPKSSLLILVSTFGGHELIMNAYRYAVADRYRFYSYGDCSFVS